MTWGKCSVCIKIDKNDRNEKKNDWERPKNSFGIYITLTDALIPQIKQRC